MQTCDPLSPLESRVLQTWILQVLILLSHILTPSTQSSEGGRTLGTDVGAASHRTIICAVDILKKSLKTSFKIFFPIHSSVKFRDDRLEKPRK